MKRGRPVSNEPEAKKRVKMETEENSDPEGRKVFVSNIDNKIPICDVKKFLLETVGDCAEECFVMPRKFGASPDIEHRGIAWIVLNRPEDCNFCITTVDGRLLGTRELKAKRHTGSSDNKKIFVWNIDVSFTNEEAQTLLSEMITQALGNDVIQSCTVMAKGKKVFGFVVVNRQEDVRPVLNLLRGKTLGKMEIRAQLHKKSNPNQQMGGRQMVHQRPSWLASRIPANYRPSGWQDQEMGHAWLGHHRISRGGRLFQGPVYPNWYHSNFN